MKSQFNFYVRAVGDSGPYNAHHTPRNKPAWAGRQNEFVATVVIKLEFVENTREPYYRVGVCVKNQKDGLPFIKKEGRQMALDRANNSAPVSTMDDVWHLILSGLSQQKNQKNNQKQGHETSKKGPRHDRER